MDNEFPQQHQKYEDAQGRILRVEGVDLTDRKGRQVVGRIWYKGQVPVNDEGTPYSCTLPTWERTWLNKEPAHERPGMEA